ncbi:helix-hairpin-helix domain-containing protein [Desulfuromonas sp. TF]|uniref:helix-hairpin-helix domain-containing protein n=1 Tax=Desulfuromonas sp. TF TaxID=1232410 RepID=UPI0004122F1B|nr:helix-hairpin-helix domain-containing protein [Desulfuromonas sp. TF]
MEKAAQNNLEQIKGVGSVLAQRLVEGGMDSFAKVLEAGEEGLRNIRGLNPRAIPSILEQARELAGEVQEGPDERLRALRETSERLQKRVQELVADIRERKSDKLSGKKGDRLEMEAGKLLKGLEKVHKAQGIHFKRARKSLAKTGKRLDGMAEGGIKGLTRGLKKARKPLKRI